jgi:hypothetical protein
VQIATAIPSQSVSSKVFPVPDFTVGQACDGYTRTRAQSSTADSPGTEEILEEDRLVALLGIETAREVFQRSCPLAQRNPPCGPVDCFQEFHWQTVMHILPAHFQIETATPAK